MGCWGKGVLASWPLSGKAECLMWGSGLNNPCLGTCSKGICQVDSGCTPAERTGAHFDHIAKEQNACQKVWTGGDGAARKRINWRPKAVHRKTVVKCLKNLDNQASRLIIRLMGGQARKPSWEAKLGNQALMPSRPTSCLLGSRSGKPYLSGCGRVGSQDTRFHSTRSTWTSAAKNIIECLS